MKKSEFDKLQKEWYNKLKDSGFKDVEFESEAESGTKRRSLQFDVGKVEYFKKCEAYLRSGQIIDPINQFIFDKHTEGVSNRQISKMLVGHGFKKIHPSNIDRRILKLLQLAQIEPYVFTK